MAPQFPIMVATVALCTEKSSKAWRYVGNRSWDPWDKRLSLIQITSKSTSGPGTSYQIGSHKSNSLAASSYASEVPTQHQRHILQIAFDFHNLPFNNSTIATQCVNRCQHWWWVHNLWGCWILMAPSGNPTSVRKEQKSCQFGGLGDDNRECQDMKTGNLFKWHEGGWIYVAYEGSSMIWQIHSGCKRTSLDHLSLNLTCPARIIADHTNRCSDVNILG